MIKSAKLFLLAGVAAISMPALASAAVVVFESDVFVGQPYTFSAVIETGDSIQWQFTAMDDVTISSFAIVASATNDGNDIREIEFGLVTPPDQVFTTVAIDKDVATGTAFLNGGTFGAGSVFSVYVTDGVLNPVGLSLSFNTGAAVASVPLPATGLLLAPFLLAGGVAGYRRRKALRAAN